MAARKLCVTPEMKALMGKPRPLKAYEGGQRLRELYQDESSNFSPLELSEFGMACYCGALKTVVQLFSSGQAPPLSGTETAYEFGYATLVIAGGQRVQALNGKTEHEGTLKFLLSRGLPPNLPDIVGYTALHHITSNPVERPDLARILLENGGNIDAQDIFATTPIFSAIQQNLIQVLDVLMEFGADIDLPEADGLTLRGLFVKGGPQVTAVMAKWIRRREGETAPREEKKCGSCGKEKVELKLCVRCKVQRYCSKECQTSDWPHHKKSCKPFKESNTVTLKPFYRPGGFTWSTADTTRKVFGYRVEQPPASRLRASNYSGAKSCIIKVQLPVDFSPILRSSPTNYGDMLIYTKKRDFACQIRRVDNPEGYDRLGEVVRKSGVSELKGYFAAELKSRNELVVKVDEVLAEQPF